LIYGILIYDKNFGGMAGSGGEWPSMSGPGFGRPGLSGYDRTGDKENLKTISIQTGGAYFEVTNKTTLGLIYETIEEELRSQYNLGYVPDAKARNGYRKIEVGVRKKGLVVHGRRGYFSNIRKTKAADRSR